MTNLEKLSEVIKETFGCEIDEKVIKNQLFPCDVVKCEGTICGNCILKDSSTTYMYYDSSIAFWSEEYKPESLSSIIPYSQDPRISYEEEKEWLDGKGGE